jgi:hypothetical protein
MLFWGATKAEIKRSLPGDDLVPNPTYTETRAITINACPEEVWRWLVQIGFRRAGWYSYDFLEAAAGAGDFAEGHSASYVHPELQTLVPGDVILMSPWTGYQVAEVNPGRALVLSSTGFAGALMPRSTWVFVLEPDGGRTRLLVRGRSEPNPRDPVEWGFNHLIEAPHFIMERRMLLGLKERAERAAASSRGRLIDRVTDDVRFRDCIEVTVKALAPAIFEALKGVTAADMPVASLLGSVRYLPGRLLGHHPIEVKQGSFMEGLQQGGFIQLGEDSGREVVFGGAGKYHQLLDQEPRPFRDPAEFEAFTDPDYQKLVIAIRVEPTGTEGLNRLVMEHRTHALSEASARKFAPYWRLIKPLGGFAGKQLLLATKHRAEKAGFTSELRPATPGEAATRHDD